MTDKSTTAKTILLVEDDPGIRELVGKILAGLSFAVHAVPDGRTALTWLRDHAPYCILLDYGLPDMNGKEFIIHLQEKDPSPPPFLVTTGQGDESIAVEMMKLGAMDYVVKDTSFLDMLPEVVKRIDHEIRNEDRLRLAEEQLLQTRKLEAIGKLAGGIAHDFNNMLAGILGATHVLRSRIKDNPDAEKFLDIISQSAERAAALTAKLLAFGRKGRKASAPVDLHRIIEDTTSILELSIDKRITVEKLLHAGHAVVLGDMAQLQNALLNMGINACQAMGDGGTLTFRTGTVLLDTEFCRSQTLPLNPGLHLRIDVADTGSGIPPGIINNIFEPFFTTKEQGSGTGLGLAMVYGTIQDHCGGITVESRVGAGTVFHLYLPVTAADAAPDHCADEIPAGSGTILFADDEKSIRVTVKAMLERYGYQVLSAENGRQAVELFQANSTAIALTILDMNMPEMDGKDAFHKIRETAPGAKVLISTGYVREDDLAGLEKAGLQGHIRKPYGTGELVRLIQRVLQEP